MVAPGNTESIAKQPKRMVSPRPQTITVSKCSHEVHGTMGATSFSTPNRTHEKSPTAQIGDRVIPNKLENSSKKEAYNATFTEPPKSSKQMLSTEDDDSCSSLPLRDESAIHPTVKPVEKARAHMTAMTKFVVISHACFNSGGSAFCLLFALAAIVGHNLIHGSRCLRCD